jgi:cytochrome c
MTRPTRNRALFTALAAVAAMSFAVPALAQFDADAAEQLFEENECTKCHSPDQPKKGPSLKKTAAKYKGKADAEKIIVAHMSKVQKVKQDDGKEVDHRLLDTKDPKVKRNVALWILSH